MRSDLCCLYKLPRTLTLTSRTAFHTQISHGMSQNSPYLHALAHRNWRYISPYTVQRLDTRMHEHRRMHYQNGSELVVSGGPINHVHPNAAQHILTFVGWFRVRSFARSIEVRSLDSTDKCVWLRANARAQAAFHDRFGRINIEHRQANSM